MNEKLKIILVAIASFVTTIVVLVSILGTVDYIMTTKGRDPIFARLPHTSAIGYTYGVKESKTDSFNGTGYVITKCEKIGEKPYYNFQIGINSNHHCSFSE